MDGAIGTHYDDNIGFDSDSHVDVVATGAPVAASHGRFTTNSSDTDNNNTETDNSVRAQLNYLKEEENETTTVLSSPDPPSSVVIMHSIASYLSLGDAMSMSVAATAASSGGGFTTPSPTRWGNYNNSSRSNIINNSGGILRSAASAPVYQHPHMSSGPSNAAAANATTIAQCHSFDYHHRQALHNAILMRSPEEEMEEDECIIAEIIANNNHYNNNINNNISYWERSNEAGNYDNNNIMLSHHDHNDDRLIFGLEEGGGEEEEEEDWFVGGGVRGLLSSPIPDDNDELQQQASWTPAGQATGECEHDERFECLAGGGNSDILMTSSYQEMEEGDCKHHALPSSRSQEMLSSSSHPMQIHRNSPPHPHDMALQKLQQRQQKQILQSKLAAAVFSHPHPLRHYCLDAYATALGLSAERRRRRFKMMMMRSSPGRGGMGSNPTVDGVGNHHNAKKEGRGFDNNGETRLTSQGARSYMSTSGTAAFNTVPISPVTYFAPPQHGPPLVHIILTAVIYDNVPLSILLELLESTCDLSLSALWATGHITTSTIEHIFSSICNVASHILDILSKFNPFHVLEFILNAQRRAMGKTGDVLVSGIQSVATGVGSVSNAALNRLSRSGLALAGGVVGSRNSNHHVGEGGAGHHHHHQHHHHQRAGNVVVGDKILDSKLFHRLQKMESVSRLVAYSERVGEEAFSAHAKKRAQRMMHYSVSFRPFTATIQAVGGSSGRKKSSSGKMKHSVSFERSVCGGIAAENHQGGDDGDGDNGSVSSESFNSSGSIFMRTPTSFPPTPTSRLYYFERGSQFTENVVFLARDQLRVERGVIDQNLQTRAMAKALIEGSRLAVFDATCVGYGIVLSCGQHIATKVGNELYSSARSMIPVMRNTYVYFEISVSPSMTRNDPSSSSGLPPTPMMDTATLLVGLSSLEMPLDTLVGAYPGTVGLCSSGQILQSGQWCSLPNPEDSSYGSSSTVGCLVYLDDSSEYDTSDGPHVTVDVTFNINGSIVPSFSSSSNNATTSTSAMQEGSSSDGCIEPTLSLIVPKALEFFPTVTLHSFKTSVMCRFNSDDLLATSRMEIGAQPGVVVYAVDGSVVLDESEEDEFLDSLSRCSEFQRSQVTL